MKSSFLIATKLAIVLSIGITLSVQAACPNNQTCGENCCWNLTNGTLTISGTGPMADYERMSAPWSSQSSFITNLQISNGITSIGNYALYGATNLTGTNIPNSITSIGQGAFAATTSLTNINIPNSVTSIGLGAFANATSLTNVIIPDSVRSIGRSAFYNTTSLTSMTIPDTEIEIYESDYWTDLSNVIIYCAGVLDQCKANMTAAGYDENTYTILQAPYSKKQSDGVTAYYDSNGELIFYKGKRIYTVQEATNVTKGNKNTFSIKYR